MSTAPGTVLRGMVAALWLGAAMAASAVDAPAMGVTLKTGWLRPVAAGAAEGRVYVDIASESDLTLVGATTPVAAKVELVDVKLTDPPVEKVVATMPVPAGKTTRLAFRGSHLRLVDVKRDLANGTDVPITLEFKTADGKKVTAQFDARVRGLLLPQQMPAADPAAGNPASPPTR